MRTYTKQEMIDCYKDAIDIAISLLRGNIVKRISAEDYVNNLPEPISHYNPISKEPALELPNFDILPTTKTKEKLFDIPANKNLKPTKGICVDCGSINGKNPGLFEYRLVDIETGVIIKNIEITGTSSNNIAEFLAICSGIAHCQLNNLTIDVYSDSLTAIAWYKHRQCRTKLIITDEHQLRSIRDAEKLLSLRPKINVKFWNKKLFGSEIPADYDRKKGKNKHKK